MPTEWQQSSKNFQESRRCCRDRKRHASSISWLHESVNSWCSEIATRYLGDSTLKWKACLPNTGATAARRRRRCPSTFTMRSARRIRDSSGRTLTLRVGYSEPAHPRRADTSFLRPHIPLPTRTVLRSTTRSKPEHRVAETNCDHLQTAFAPISHQSF